MNRIKSSYVLGVVLGICISMLLLITDMLFFRRIFSVKNDKDMVSRNIEASLAIENAELKNQIKKLSEKENLTTTSQEIVIEISEGMTNSEIADLIVNNNIYNHKEDLLFMMEIIRIDGWKYVVSLENDGVMRYGGDFLSNIDSIYNNREFSAQKLQEAGYVQDTKMFEKFISLLNNKEGIKFGIKTFYTGMSLIEVTDVLINS